MHSSGKACCWQGLLWPASWALLCTAPWLRWSKQTALQLDLSWPLPASQVTRAARMKLTMHSAQLLRLLVEHALEPEVVLLAAPALASVLGAHRDITLAALERADGLAALGSAVAAQAQAAVPAKVPTAPQVSPRRLCSFAACAALAAWGPWTPICMSSKSAICSAGCKGDISPVFSHAEAWAHV